MWIWGNEAAASQLVNILLHLVFQEGGIFIPEKIRECGFIFASLINYFGLLASCDFYSELLSTS